MMDKSALCLKCMICCRMLSFRVPARADILEFYKARGASIQLIMGSTDMYVSIPHICPKLTERGCSIYESRPYQCKIFDGSTFPTTARICLWSKEI